ncbi:MAG: uroporphyrinogen-III synthase, partial [Verrucomicrobiota bacterium]
AIVDTLPLYATSKSDLNTHQSAEIFRQRGADVVLFTSSSTVRSYIEQADKLTLAEEARRPVYASIGPQTTKSLKDAGLPVAFEAPKSTLEHYVVETISYFQADRLSHNPK